LRNASARVVQSILCLRQIAGSFLSAPRAGAPVNVIPSYVTTAAPRSAASVHDEGVGTISQAAQERELRSERTDPPLDFLGWLDHGGSMAFEQIRYCVFLLKNFPVHLPDHDHSPVVNR